MERVLPSSAEATGLSGKVHAEDPPCRLVVQNVGAAPKAGSAI